MTDRELLELAAKAAGYAVDCGFDDCPLIYGFDAGPDGPREWNPLTDDGDALRLAVDLRLEIELTESTVLVEFETLPSATQLELLGSEPHAATRRAIVRAAAEIGRLTP